MAQQSFFCRVVSVNDGRCVREDDDDVKDSTSKRDNINIMRVRVALNLDILVFCCSFREGQSIDRGRW